MAIIESDKQEQEVSTREGGALNDDLVPNNACGMGATTKPLHA